MIVPKLRAPIVLVHGLLGFDQLKVCGWTIKSYFSGIPEVLRSGPNRVLIPTTSPTRGVADRAAQLKAFLDRESPQEPVHIIAHSMGGLDSRYLISRLDMGRRVLTLTTIGTPHRGTTFADWGIQRLEPVVKPMFEWLAIPQQAFYDLTTEKCRRFNTEVRDVPDVRYFSIAGLHQEAWSRPEWNLPFRVVTRNEGPNDGVVSLASATYGESCEVWPGDHLSLVNWKDPISPVRNVAWDRREDYARHVGRLADEGF